jgi:dTDP-4-dehydrorhamnose reductase
VVHDVSEMKVAVLGASGMLGSIVVDYLSRFDYQIVAYARDREIVSAGSEQLPHVVWHQCHIESARGEYRFPGIDECRWVINAIGVTKPRIREDDPASVREAITVNSLLPLELVSRLTSTSTEVLQIATDAVFCGSRGQYHERDLHDCVDVYGKTKSLGEVHHPRMHHLRCSIVGRSLKPGGFLLDWLLGHPRGACLRGYTDHLWSGVTALHFAKLCHGIMREEIRLPHLLHVVPSDSVSKAEFLRLASLRFGRSDLVIQRVESGSPVSRELRTERPELNAAVWRAAGYTAPPTIALMLEELAEYRMTLVV